MPIDIMICGAQKSGTTSLLRTLGQGRNVRRQRVDELGGLLDPSARLGSEAFEREWFGGTGSVTVGKHASLMYRPNDLRRFCQSYPDAKLVTVLRDPSRRAYSAFWHAKRAGIEQAESLSIALSNQENLGTESPYVQMSRYDIALEALVEAAERNEILVVQFERLKSADYLNWLQEKLGLDSSTPDETQLVHANESARSRSSLLARLTGGQGALRRVGLVLPAPVRRPAGRLIRSANRVPYSPPPATAHEDSLLSQSLSGVGPRVNRLFPGSIDESLWTSW